MADRVQDRKGMRSGWSWGWVGMGMGMVRVRVRVRVGIGADEEVRTLAMVGEVVGAEAGRGGR